MDEVPLPDYDEYFRQLGTLGLASDVAPWITLPYEGARGCWWGEKSHCTFCGLNGTTMAFRSKSPARVVDEVVGLAARHQRLQIGMVDNIIDHRYLTDVLPPLRDRGLDLDFFYEVKANLKREHVRALRAAGVDDIQPGIESLSTPILRLMRKGVTAFQNVRLLKWCAEYGVEPHWNIIFGFPGEPVDEYRRMAELVPSLVHLEPPNLSRLAVERFSPYFQRPEAFGLRLTGPAAYYRHLYPAEGAALAELAYAFEHEYLDGRDPESYCAPLLDAVLEWRARRAKTFRALRYRRGPGFLLIRDERGRERVAEFRLGELESRIYLACEDGARPEDIARGLEAGDGPRADADAVRVFLDSLVGERLIFAEGDRYLSLALPWTLPEQH